MDVSRNNTPASPTRVSLDLESQRFQELGGRRGIHRLGLSVAVTYNSCGSAFHSYAEDTVPELTTELQRTDQVIGLNLLRFGYPVLSAYTSVWLHSLPTVVMPDPYPSPRFSLGS